MSILTLVLLLAGLAFVLGEILVKDPRVLLELAGTREFALNRLPERAPQALGLPPSANDRAAARPDAAAA